MEGITSWLDSGDDDYDDVLENKVGETTTYWDEEEIDEDDEYGVNEDDDDYDDNAWSLIDNQESRSQDTQVGRGTRDKTEKFLKSSMTFKEYTETVGGSADMCEESSGSTVKVCQRGTFLPPVFRCMMGEANLKCVRGDYNGALELCFEVIREVPNVPAPFQTLMQIFEDKGEIDKSLQFGLIAAHLRPRSSDQWVHLAEMSVKQNNIQQAIRCYTKAIKYDKKNLDYHLMKIKLQESIKDKKGVVKTYHHLVEHLNPEHGVEILQYAKITAKLYHELGDVKKAKEVMDNAFNKVPSLVGMEDVKLFVELLLSLKDYLKAFEVISLHCDVKIEAEEDILEEGEVSSFRIISCDIPDNIPVDIRAQLTVSLIHTQAFHILPDVLPFFEHYEDIEQSGDILLDIIEALMSHNKHTDALKLTKLLVCSKNFSLAAVWLNYAECLKECNKAEEAISAYLMVMQLAPNHVGARIIVSELLNNVGRREEAISVLTQDPSSELMNTQLLYEKCLLLKDNSEKKDEFLVFGRLLLSRHFLAFKDKSELVSFSRLRVSANKKEFIRRIIQEQAIEKTKDVDFVEEKQILTIEKEWELFVLMCNVAYEIKQYPLLQRLVFCALGSTKMNTDVYCPDLLKMAILACFFNKDGHLGFNLCKEALFNDMDNKVLWNIFNLILYNLDILRFGKFIMRQISQQPNHPALTAIHANNCLVSGSFKYALSEYISCFHQEPNAYLALLISITLLQMAGLKSAEKKSSLLTQSIAFMWEYKRYRCSAMEQEVHYNLGRAFHQLGLLSHAVFHYKKALNSSSELINEHPDVLDMKSDIAFNLALIYKSSGSMELAQYYIEKYIVF